MFFFLVFFAPTPVTARLQQNPSSYNIYVYVHIMINYYCNDIMIVTLMAVVVVLELVGLLRQF